MRAARLVGGLLLLANWPVSLFAIKPTNDRLNATPPDAAGGESRALLRRWSRLHAIRATLGAASILG